MTRMVVIYGSAVYEDKDADQFPPARDYPDGCWLVTDAFNNTMRNKGIRFFYVNKFGSWQTVNEADVPNDILTWMLLGGI